MLAYTYSDPNLGIIYITDCKYDTPSLHNKILCKTMEVTEKFSNNYYREEHLPKAFFEIHYHCLVNDSEFRGTEWFYCTYAQAITCFWLNHNESHIVIDYITEYGKCAKYNQYITPTKHYIGKTESELLSHIVPSTQNLVISLLSYHVGHNTTTEELELNENMILPENEYSVSRILEVGKDIIDEYEMYYKRVEDTRFEENINLLDSLKTIHTDTVCRAVAEMCGVLDKPLITPFHTYTMLITESLPAISIEDSIIQFIREEIINRTEE